LFFRTFSRFFSPPVLAPTLGYFRFSDISLLSGNGGTWVVPGCYCVIQRSVK
jgi:hypothetical protein